MHIETALGSFPSCIREPDAGIAPFEQCDPELPLRHYNS